MTNSPSDQIVEVARTAVEEIRRQDLLRHFPRADETWVKERSRHGSEHFATEFKAALSALKQAGFAIVPVEPTRAMRDAGAEAEFWPRSLGGEASACVGRGAALAAYRAMLEALEGRATPSADPPNPDLEAINGRLA